MSTVLRRNVRAGGICKGALDCAKTISVLFHTERTRREYVRCASSTSMSDTRAWLQYVRTACSIVHSVCVCVCSVCSVSQYYDVLASKYTYTMPNEAAHTHIRTTELSCSATNTCEHSTLRYILRLSNSQTNSAIISVCITWDQRRSKQLSVIPHALCSTYIRVMTIHWVLLSCIKEYLAYTPKSRYTFCLYLWMLYRRAKLYSW